MRKFWSTKYAVTVLEVLVDRKLIKMLQYMYLLLKSYFSLEYYHYWYLINVQEVQTPY